MIIHKIFPCFLLFAHSQGGIWFCCKQKHDIEILSNLLCSLKLSSSYYFCLCGLLLSIRINFKFILSCHLLFSVLTDIFTLSGMLWKNPFTHIFYYDWLCRYQHSLKCKIVICIYSITIGIRFYSSANLLHFIFIDVNIFIFSHMILFLVCRIAGRLLHLKIMIFVLVLINSLW